MLLVAVHLFMLFLDLLQPIKGEKDVGLFNNFLPVVNKERRTFGLFQAVYFDDIGGGCKNTRKKELMFPVMCVRQNDHSQSLIGKNKNDQLQFSEVNSEQNGFHVTVYEILFMALAGIGVVFIITVMFQSRQSPITGLPIELTNNSR